MLPSCIFLYSSWLLHPTLESVSTLKLVMLLNLKLKTDIVFFFLCLCNWSPLVIGFVSHLFIGVVVMILYTTFVSVSLVKTCAWTKTACICLNVLAALNVSCITFYVRSNCKFVCIFIIPLKILMVIPMIFCDHKQSIQVVFWNVVCMKKAFYWIRFTHCNLECFLFLQVFHFVFY